jgi:hypothetical protein
MSYSQVNEARNVILDLQSSLHKRYQIDLEAEISNYDLRTIDAVLNMAAAHVGGHPVIVEMRELFSPESVAEGEPIRVESILTNVDLLAGVLSRRAHEMLLDEPGAVRRRGAE